MRWVGHVTHIRTGFWCGSLKVRDNLQDLGIAMRIILKWGGVGWQEVGLVNLAWDEEK
jgi:hypothetical protein